jgi:hypothetical protein
VQAQVNAQATALAILGKPVVASWLQKLATAFIGNNSCSASGTTAVSTTAAASNGTAGYPFWPVGIVKGWASENVSLNNVTGYSQPITLREGVNVSQVNSTQAISSVAENRTIVQFKFSTNATVSMSFHSSQLPKSVYADANRLQFGSQWTYSNSTMTINRVDPRTITIIYASGAVVTGPSSAIPAIPWWYYLVFAATAIIIIVAVTMGMVTPNRKRARPNIPNAFNLDS